MMIFTRSPSLPILRSSLVSPRSPRKAPQEKKKAQRVATGPLEGQEDKKVLRWPRSSLLGGVGLDDVTRELTMQLSLAKLPNFQVIAPRFLFEPVFECVLRSL